jgi:hypothetical protein
MAMCGFDIRHDAAIAKTPTLLKPHWMDVGLFVSRGLFQLTAGDRVDV